MVTIVFPLKLQMQNRSVGDLQDALVSLGFAIAASEQQAMHFGATTRQAVLEFQMKHGLTPSGEVDAGTAHRLNEALKSGRTPGTGRTYSVRGRIISADGQPAAGVVVRAFDQDVAGHAHADIIWHWLPQPSEFLRTILWFNPFWHTFVEHGPWADHREARLPIAHASTNRLSDEEKLCLALSIPSAEALQRVARAALLGEATTDAAGRYEIRYSESTFRQSPGERGGPELFVLVSDPGGRPLGHSNTIKDAARDLQLDLTLPVLPELSFLVQGRITYREGQPAAQALVRVYDRDEAGETLLGEATTDDDGRYALVYAESRFRRAPAARGGPDLLLRIFGQDSRLLGQSPLLRNAAAEATLDAVVSTGAFRVFGRVTKHDGRAAPGLTVVACDRDLRTEKVIGTAVSDAEGRYEILYGREQLARVGKDRADLVVRVFSETPASGSEHGTALVESDPRFSAPDEAEITLTLPRSEPEPSEIERYFATLLPRLEGQDVSWATLTAEDMDFLAGGTGIDREHLTKLVLSMQRCDETAFPSQSEGVDELVTASGTPLIGPEAFYGWFRQGLPTTLPELLGETSGTLRKALRDAVAANMVPAALAESIDHLVDTGLANLRARQDLAPAADGGRASLGDLLQTLPDAESFPDRDRVKFARLHRQIGDTDELWEKAREVGLGDRIPDLKRTLLLGEITLSHTPMVRALQHLEIDERQPDSAVHLARLSRNDWQELALTHGVPPGSPLSAADYGLELERSVERRYTSAALRERLSSGEITIKDFPAGSVVEFLSAHPGFDIRNEQADVFLERVEAKTPELSSALRKVQRVLPLTGELRASAAVLNAGFDSAYAISRTGAKVLAGRLAGEVTEEAANAIHAAAQDVGATLLALVARYSGLFNRHSIPAIGRPAASTPVAITNLSKNLQAFMNGQPRNSAFLDKYPSLRALFGDLDYCACRHCQSVLGPAAYLSDLLHFLETSGPFHYSDYCRQPTTTVFLALFARRPDLASLLLTCENTNIEIPYIDLVLEILENAVALSPTPLEVEVSTNNSVQLLSDLEAGRVPAPIREALKMTAITIADEISATPLSDMDYWSFFALCGNVFPTSRNTFFKIDDGSRRWLTTYYRRSRRVLLIKAKTASAWNEMVGEELDIAGDVEEWLREGLNKGEVPPEFRKGFADTEKSLTGFGCSVVWAIEDAGSLPEPEHGPLCVLAANISLRSAICLEIITGSPSATVRWTRVDGQALREKAVSEESGLLISCWLKSDEPLMPKDVSSALSCEEWEAVPLTRTHDPATGRWTLRFNFWPLTVATPAPILQVFSLTHRSSSIHTDLAAVPENRNPAAYEVLRKAVFPWTLPLDLWTEEIRVYLQELGVPRQRLMEIARPLDSQSDGYCREVLGLTVADRVLDVTNLWASWGLAEDKNTITDTLGKEYTGSWTEVLQNVSIILQQSGLSYRELLDIRQTGAGVVTWTAISPAGECHPARMKWEAIDRDQLKWIFLFTHLWRRIGWSMRELSSALSALPDPTVQCSYPLSLVARLRSRLKQPIMNIIAMLGCMEVKPWIDHATEGEPVSPSLYDRVFQSPALRPGASFPHFAINPTSGELKYRSGPNPPPFQTLGQHAHFLAAALGITPDDVAQLLLPDNKLDIADELKRSTLTLLFGMVSFCRSLQLGIADFIRWTKILGNPFKVPDFSARAKLLLQFADDLEFARQSGTSLDELAYLLQHDLSGEFEDADSRMRTTLAGIRDTLLKGSLLGNLSLENLTTQLKKLGASEKLLAAISGERGLSTELKAEVEEIPGHPLPDPLPDLRVLPGVDAGRFYYPKNASGKPSGLGCRGIVRDEDFAKLPTSLSTYGTALKQRYERRVLIRQILCSQLLFLVRAHNDSSLPSFPHVETHYDCHATDPAPSLPEDLQAFFEVTKNAGPFLAADPSDPHSSPVQPFYTITLFGLITGEQCDALKGMLSAELTAPLDRLRLLSDEVRKEGIPLLDVAQADDLLAPGDEEILGMLLKLVPILEIDLLTSQLGSVMGLEPPVMQWLLTTVTLPTASATTRTALDLLTGEWLLGSSRSVISKPKPGRPGEALGAGALQGEVLFRLDKAARLVRRSGLAGEIWEWLEAARFMLLQFENLPVTSNEAVVFQDWRALCELIRFNNAVAGGAATLDFLVSRLEPSGATADEVELRFAERYGLARSQVTAARLLVQPNWPDDFRNPGRLLHFIQFLQVLKQLGTTVEVIKGLIADAPGAADAMAARKLFMAQFDAETLPKRLQPVSNKLRVRQRDALVSYLKARDKLPDENALLDYYLIDAKMEPCMRTSRIKQAISSVQLFIQRCLLNLERENLVLPSDIDTTRWLWMKNYRVWEANRKVFLYPENWIEPDLRDDKSEIFRAFESDLQQSEITHDTALMALSSYLDKMGGVVNLTVVSIFEESLSDDEGTLVHLIGRDNSQPYKHYYRQWKRLPNQEFGTWTAWEEISAQVDSDHPMVFLFDGSVCLAWPSISGQGTDHRWQVRMNLCKRTTSGWTKLKKARGDIINSMVPDKDERTGFLFRLEFDKPPHAAFIRCFAASKPEGQVETQIREETFEPSHLNPPDPFGIYNIWIYPNIRTFAQFRDSLGRVFYYLATDIICKYEIEFKWEKNNDVDKSWYSGTIEGDLPRSDKYLVLKDIIASNFPGVSKGERHLKQINSIAIKASANTSRYHDYSFYSQHTLDKSDANWVIDIVFVLQPGQFPEGVTANSVQLEYVKSFKLTDDEEFETFSEEPAPTLPLALPHTANFNSGYREMIGDSSDPDSVLILPPTTEVLGKTPGQFFVVQAQSEGPSEPSIWSYRDTKVSLIFWKKATTDLKYRVVPFTTLGMSDLKSRVAHGRLLEAIELPLAIEKGVLTPIPLPQLPALGLDPTETPGVDSPHSVVAVKIDFGPVPTSPYNWEVFFHIPLLVATQLGQAQRFAEAQRWFHLIFDPTTNDPESETAIRYWRFQPFREEGAERGQGEGIDAVLSKLAQDSFANMQALREEIEAWKNDPFKPHLIARYRIRAYQWAVVIKYIENLIAWGDQLFRRETIESINEATQLYVLAARILGPRPASIPRCKQLAGSYLELRPGLDEFSNAWVTLEDLGTATPLFGTGTRNPNVGSIESPLKGLYFCIPPNSGIEELWDSVDDRLFNVRHCRNIDGVERRLPLFEPPIDPALLVKAAAAGLDISSVLADLAAPLPIYRFNIMLQKALEVCAELKSLGVALLAALEKNDVEALSLLRGSHEIELLHLTEQVRKQQIEEAKFNLEGLIESRKTAVERYKYYHLLLGKSEIEVPQPDAIVTLEPISPNLAKSGLDADTTGLGLILNEVGQLQSLSTANDLTTAAGAVSTLAAILHILPDTIIGIGSQIKIGGSHLGNAANAMSSLLNMLASRASHDANKKSLLAGYERRQGDWTFQGNMALRELQQIDKQIAATEIRLAIANTELDNLKKQAENALEVDEFMHSKFTNRDLYRWMSGQLSAIYFRTVIVHSPLRKAARPMICMTESES